LLHRLRVSIAWVAAQFWATLLIALACLAWTRLPDRHAWQVLFSLLLPVLIAAAALLLQTGTMRSLLATEPVRKPLVWAMLMLAAWAVVVWISWTILDWCDDQIPAWASYLNSRASAHWRAHLFTYAHLAHWLTLAEWVLRWIAVPGKVIAYALACAVSGWRVPVGRVLRVLWNWRWWPVVIVAALLGVALPMHLFNGLPQGSVHHQVWAVILKLLGASLLAVVSWILLLAWGAVLLARNAPRPKSSGDDALVAVPLGSAPLGSDSVHLPLPDSGDSGGGNA
jgi:hypothetical protein